MKGEVVIYATPQKFYVKPGLKMKDFHVLVSLQTRESEKDSPPLELSVVLDKSGSMAGAKLKWALRAIRKIVKHLRPKDTFHLVTYDTGVQVVFERGDLGDKNLLYRRIKGIKAGSCTNLGGGLKRGFELLTKLEDGSQNEEEEEEVIKPIKRIFLFSDGQANVGIRKHEEMFELVRTISSKGVTITSFGIGNDFDEKMMKGIAEHGMGRYLFLEPATITKQVSKSIHGLLDLVGTEAKFHFKEKYGTEISRMYANELDSATDYQIGDLNGENLKMILIQMNLSVPQAESITPPFNFLSYEFEYKSKKMNGEKVTVKGDFICELSSDSELLEQESMSVLISKQIQNAGDVNEEILQLVDHDKMEEAIELKEKLIGDLEKIEKDDETGHVTLILENERESLEKLKDQKNNPYFAKKQIGFDRYRARQMSFCCLKRGVDSDEDNYSSDDDGKKDIKPSLPNIQGRRRRQHSFSNMIGMNFPLDNQRNKISCSRSRSSSLERKKQRRKSTDQTRDDTDDDDIVVSIRGRCLSGGDGQLIGDNKPIYLGRRNRSSSPSNF